MVNPTYKTLTAVLVFLASTQIASAIDYRIEVVLFENIKANQAPGGQTLYIPRRGAAIGLNTGDAEAAGFSLVDDGMELSDQADSIRRSAGYRLLKHFAWRQPGLDNRNAKAIRVNVGRTMDVHIPVDYQEFKKFIPAQQSSSIDGSTRQLTTTSVNGTLKVRLGRFLHLDSRLVFTDVERATSFRLDHSRKMRSRELHYIDNPRFGLLVKILPIEGT